MADAQLEERLDKAYIRPIRTVLAIDDEFPQYGADPTGKQLVRAKAIWQACRKRGLLCDIDDGAAIVSGGETPKHLLKSDLVILDYHLQENDERWALELLVQLADSDHASLVVVYTKDEKLAEIRRKVAAHLRGKKPIEGWLENDEQKAAWEKHEAKLEGVGVSGKMVDAFIGGRLKECRSDKATRSEFERVGVPKQHISACLNAHLESQVHALTKRYAVEGKAPPAVGASEKSPWVFANNLFVVCVNKTPENAEDGELVFGQLLDALCEWNPNFMYASLAFARAEFMRGGFQHERAALNDARLQSGWLYHAWAGSVHEQKDRLRTLFERVINGYSTSLLERVIEFGGSLVPTTENPNADMETLRAAIQEFNEDGGALEAQVVHLLNSFLVVEPHKNFIETGTIFVRKDDKELKQVYICVTPACDLVPRIPKGYLWENEIHPSRPIIAIRCTMRGIDDGCLMAAEQGKNIFIMIDNEPKTLVIMDGSRPIPILEWFVVEKMGEITAKEFDALEFVKSKPNPEDEGRFANRSVKMRVLGQVRALYASRIQQYAGQHLSRIGVDFVGLPEQPKKKEKPAKATPATAASVEASTAPAVVVADATSMATAFDGSPPAPGPDSSAPDAEPAKAELPK
jgi:hypothetical protein